MATLLTQLLNAFVVCLYRTYGLTHFEKHLEEDEEQQDGRSFRFCLLSHETREGISHRYTIEYAQSSDTLLVCFGAIFAKE